MHFIKHQGTLSVRRGRLAIIQLTHQLQTIGHKQYLVIGVIATLVGRAVAHKGIKILTTGLGHLFLHALGYTACRHHARLGYNHLVASLSQHLRHLGTLASARFRCNNHRLRLIHRVHNLFAVVCNRQLWVAQHMLWASRRFVVGAIFAAAWGKGALVGGRHG